MNKKNNLLISILTFLILFVFFKPQTMGKFYYFNIICNGLATALTFFMLIIYVFNIKKYQFTTMTLLYIGTLFVATYINNGSIKFFFTSYTSIIGVVAFSEIYMKKNKNTYFKNLNYFIIIMLVINFISIFFSNGNWGERASFLGYDNGTVPFIALGTIIVLAYSYYTKNKFDWISKFTFIIYVSTSLLVESSNAKVIAALMILFCILLVTKIVEKNWFTKIFNYRNYIVVSIILFVTIVICRLQYIFQELITNKLHRSMTFTGRTYIWDRTIKYFKKEPFLGYGVEDTAVRAVSKGIFHAHSTYLNILLEGGIVSFITYMLFLFFSGKNDKNEDNNKVSIIISFGAFLYFVMTVIEFYRKSHMFFVLLLFLYYIKDFKNDNKEHKKNEKNVNNFVGVFTNTSS